MSRDNNRTHSFTVKLVIEKLTVHLQYLPISVHLAIKTPHQKIITKPMALKSRLIDNISETIMFDCKLAYRRSREASGYTYSPKNVEIQVIGVKLKQQFLVGMCSLNIAALATKNSYFYSNEFELPLQHCQDLKSSLTLVATLNRLDSAVWENLECEHSSHHITNKSSNSNFDNPHAKPTSTNQGRSHHTDNRGESSSELNCSHLSQNSNSNNNNLRESKVIAVSRNKIMIESDGSVQSIGPGMSSQHTFPEEDYIPDEPRNSTPQPIAKQKENIQEENKRLRHKLEQLSNKLGLKSSQFAANEQHADTNHREQHEQHDHAQEGETTPQRQLPEQFMVTPNVPRNTAPNTVLNLSGAPGNLTSVTSPGCFAGTNSPASVSATHHYETIAQHKYQFDIESVLQEKKQLEQQLVHMKNEHELLMNRLKTFQKQNQDLGSENQRLYKMLSEKLRPGETIS